MEEFSPKDKMYGPRQGVGKGRSCKMLSIESGAVSMRRAGCQGRWSKPRTALSAEVGRWRGFDAAVRTGLARLFMAEMNHQVADVGNPGKGVGKNEDGIPFVKHGVRKEEKRTGQAQPPE